MINNIKRGSCMCGAIQYEVEGVPEWVAHCHCSLCRKHHGAAFGTYAGYPTSRFRLTVGQEMLRSYCASRQTKREFCGTCGSSLFFREDKKPEEVAITLGTLCDDPGKAPEGHYLVGSKASWYEITDGLPQHS
jgi:hypothetical protein